MPYKDASLFGFLSGWLYWIAMMTGLAFMTNGLSDLLSQWFLKGEESSWLCFLISFSLLVLATFINLARVSTSSLVVNLLTTFKFFMVFFFLFLVLFAQAPSAANLF
ncbi:MAG TPA: amino acid permease, partial [Candidatus Melainabacteria bacterium]|nr:amino acid permease [Candidatus Melainabacteria bacterium]